MVVSIACRLARLEDCRALRNGVMLASATSKRFSSSRSVRWSIEWTIPFSVRSQRNKQNIIVVAAINATVVVLKAVPISATTVGSLSPISPAVWPPNAVPKWTTVPRNPNIGVTQQMKRIRP